MNFNQGRRRGIWLTLAVLVAFMLFVVGMFVRQFVHPERVDRDWLRLNQAVLYDTPRRFSPLKLVDHDGQPFSGDRFEGNWNVLFFGFTYCADVCPTTLALLRDVNAVLEEPGKNRLPVRFFMVSVDPARDTPAQLKRYVEHFSPAFTGLTGEFLDIARFASESNTAFQKVVASDGSYSVVHSANLVLLDPQGNFAGFMMPPFDKDRLRRVIEALRRQK